MAPQVLIIESDEECVEQFGQAFRDAGCEVRLARDGEAGLAEVRASLPGLVVLSAELRGVRSGYTVCKALKRDEATSAVPVFILSATATPQIFDEHRRLPTRAEEYFKKPVAGTALVEAASRYLPIDAAPRRPAANDGGFGSFEADLDALLGGTSFAELEDLGLEELEPGGFLDLDGDAGAGSGGASVDASGAATVVPGMSARSEPRRGEHQTVGSDVVGEIADSMRDTPSGPRPEDSAPSVVSEGEAHTPIVAPAPPTESQPIPVALPPLSGPVAMPASGASARTERLLRERLEAAEAEAVRLKDDAYRAQRTQTEAVARCEAAEQQAHQLRTELAAARAELHELSGTADAQAEELGVLRSERERAETRAAEQANLAQGLAEDLAQAQSALAARDEQIASLQGEILASDAARDDAAARAASHAAELASAKADNSSRRIEYEAIRAALHATTAELDASRGEGGALRDRVNALEGDLQRVRDELAGALGEAAGLNGSLAERQAALDAVTSQHAELSGELEGTRTSLDEARAAIAALNEEITRRDETVAAVNDELDNVRGELNATRAALETSIAHAQTLQEQLETRTAEAEALRAENDGANAELVAARAELDAVRVDLEQAVEQLAAKQSALSAAEARVANLDTEITELRGAIARQQELAASLQGEIEAIGAARDEQIARSAALKTELEQAYETVAVRDLAIEGHEERAVESGQRITELLATQTTMVSELSTARDLTTRLEQELTASRQQGTQTTEALRRAEAEQSRLGAELAAVRSAHDAEVRGLNDAGRRVRTHYESRVQQLVDKLAAAESLIQSLTSDHTAAAQHAEGLAELLQSREQFFQHIAGELSRVARLASTVDPLPSLETPGSSSSAIAAQYARLAVDVGPYVSGSYRVAPPLRPDDSSDAGLPRALTGAHAAVVDDASAPGVSANPSDSAVTNTDPEGELDGAVLAAVLDDDQDDLGDLSGLVDDLTELED